MLEKRKKNIVLTVSYDGTHYFGWQQTKMGPSIEESLKRAIASFLQVASELQAASRTDRGVHAEGQVVNFFCESLPFPIEKLPHVINRYLPPDIRVKSASFAPKDSFHPTLDAVSKEYQYTIYTGSILSPFKRHQVWHYPTPLSLDLMEQAKHCLIGKKDFSGFVNQGSDRNAPAITTIHTLDIRHEADLYFFSIQGTHFHYKMVRNIVGTLAYIGTKKIPVEVVKNILDTKDRTLAGMTAPAAGLVLNEIHY